MNRRLPSLNAMRAAEAVFRLGGVAAAARDLNVSQPAVSQQLRLLEADLGTALFRRDKGRLTPTATGALLLPRLTDAFGLIAEAVARVDDAGGDSLTVAVLPTFAMRWLIPRLGDFEARHPAMDLRLATASAPLDKLRDGTADLGILLGRSAGDWPGLEARLLMPDDMFPVAAPAVAAALHRPADLAGVPRLAVEAPVRAGDWARWLDAAGVADLAPVSLRLFDSSAQALSAAVAGLGVALGHRSFVGDDLAAGRLVQPFALTVPAPETYWLAWRPGRDRTGAARMFTSWLAEIC
ncbi:LysR substrate-binding domain-containing protein [Zavarzinia compransoris]|uniref:LysR substrate-binding domain-containing protein n=1 Tax=Zavarzinia marina TaxID=2911065 RepID=UPI001F37613C|nr:LysR substrate-binding domain-containing protein [Zavarzinia marina]MCF4165963.1 LysR substrate-binding domain-containing protein [Zavarzinia marina]